MTNVLGSDFIVFKIMLFLLDLFIRDTPGKRKFKFCSKGDSDQTMLRDVCQSSYLALAMNIH